MAATIVHFGEDACFRLPVLRSAGYSIEACGSLDCLSDLLDIETEAVMLEEAAPSLLRKVANLARARSQASLVLFHNEPGLVDADGFDLVIPALTVPEDWLKEIAELLERSRAIRTDFKALYQSSASLRDESAAVRARTKQLREDSIRRRSMELNDPWGMPGSEPGTVSD